MPMSLRVTGRGAVARLPLGDAGRGGCDLLFRDLLVDLGGFFLGLAGGLRAHLDVLDDAKLLVLALDDLHARLETLVRALGEGLVRLLDSLVNHALAIVGLRLSSGERRVGKERVSTCRLRWLA